MKISMTAQGDSEQIVGLTADIVPEAIQPMSRSVYKDMDYFFGTNRTRRLRQAAYAMARVTAKIEWRPPFDETNLDARYVRATLLPQDIARARLADIHSYADAIKSGDVFPLPILFKQNHLLIQADGARRIVSHKLAGLDEMEVIVVIERTQIREILDGPFIDEIQHIQSSSKWFGAYQDIVELGIEGKREASRRFPGVIDLSCCLDRTVVDFGCNVGHALFEACFNGAKRCVGFEYEQSNVDIINKIASKLELPVEAYCIDFNEKDYEKRVRSIIEDWDYSLFLSVYRTLELKDRDGLLQFIWKHTRESMFFEGHSEDVDTRQFYEKVFQQLPDAEARLLGTTDDLGSSPRLNYELERKVPPTVGHRSSRSSRHTVGRVTVLMPMLNAEMFLEGAIKSILSQSERDFTFLIVDDGSTDDSPEIAEKLADHRTRIIRDGQHLGIAARLNWGLDHADTEFVARMDADDISAPHRLSRQLAFMEEHPETAICGSWYRMLQTDAPPVGMQLPLEHERLRAMTLFASPFAHPTVMFNMRHLDAAGLRYSEAAAPAEDYDLWERACTKTVFANIPEFLLFYRSHDGQVSAVRREQQRSAANNVRKRALQRLGIEPTPLELTVHCDLASDVDMERAGRIRPARRWLRKLGKHAQQHGYPAIADECAVRSRQLKRRMGQYETSPLQAAVKRASRLLQKGG